MNCLTFCSRRRNDFCFQGAAVSRPPNKTTAVWKAPLLVIFAFVVRNFRWLARVPGAPQIFDAALLLSTALFSPRRLRAISAIETKAQRLADVRLGVHRYGGIGFFLHGKEMGHIHGNGLLDCLVGQRNRDLLLRESRGVTAHHVFPRSGWISFFVKAPDDVERALELIQIARAYRESAEDTPQRIRARDLR
jgi:hypothetical protein